MEDGVKTNRTTTQGLSRTPSSGLAVTLSVWTITLVPWQINSFFSNYSCSGVVLLLDGLGMIFKALHFVKMSILDKAAGVDVWIETGTYLGQTTRKLSKIATRVISIEPSLELVNAARKRLRRLSNIEIIQGLSENHLGPVLSTISSQNSKSVAFWLDGHYSQGTTYLGPVETPIIDELQTISENLPNFQKIWVFVDDFRCFVSRDRDYPLPELLVHWAVGNQLRWSVQHDIFIATNDPEAIL